MRTQTTRKAELFAHALRTTILGVFALVSILFAFNSLLTGKTDAAVNTTLNFQARLQTSTGSIVPDGTYNVEFKLYDALTSSGSSQGSCTGDVHCLWTEDYTSGNKVTVAHGYLSVTLGSQTPFPGTINWDQELYLTMRIGGTGSPSWDTEMNPRLRLTGVPYAFQAKSAAQLQALQGGFTSTLNFQTPTGGNQTFQIQDQGAAGTYNLLTQNQANANYIQNQNAGAQTTANYWISGTGRADTSILTPAVDTATATTLSLGTTTANAVNISRTGVATTVNGSLVVTQATTLNDNVTVAAGKSLTITGGNTGSRPGSPTEGMVYFDTTTKQLLTYANGKWQSDRSTSTKIVAASNASQALKDAADYVASGTGDQSTINSALTAAAGGKVYLTEGTYTLSAAISVPNNTTLEGAGAGTIITIPNAQNGSYYMITNTDTSTGTGVTITNLTVDGNKANQSSGSMKGIYLNGVGSTTRAGSNVNNISVKNIYGTGIGLDDSNYNTISDNLIQGNREEGIGLYSLSNVDHNIIRDNRIHDNGGSSHNNGIYILGGSYNSIIDNNITDTSCTTDCFAINFDSIFGYKNILSGNIFSGSATNAASIANAGANTIYSNQQTNGTTSTNGDVSDFSFRGSVNSTTAFSIQNSSGTAAFNVNTTSNTVQIAGTLDTTTATALNIGTTNATGINLNQSTTLAAGKVLTNNGATLLGTLALSNFGSGGSIGSAGSTVDIYTSININQTTGGQSLTLPSPSGGVAGRLVFIGNVGSAGFTMYGFNVDPGGNAAFVWNGSSWAIVGNNIGSSGSYIQNQNASQQALANFWISGTGRADTSLLTPLLDTATATALGIGTTNATVINLNQDTAVTGAHTLTVGTGLTQLGGNLTVAGTSTLTGLLTANGGITVGSNQQFTNNGATLNGVMALGDLATGPLGTAAATVDVATAFSINPSASGRTYSIPSPTSNTAGRIIYISNISANDFSIGSNSIAAGSNVGYIWNGSAWAPTGLTGVTTIGSISGTANANGATITGNTLNLTVADNTNGGVVSNTTQTFGGQKTFANLVTASAGLTVQTGSTFTNASSTLNTAIALSDFPSGGSIGSAPSTVDVATSFTINQTTSGQTITLPSPTGGAAGRTIYISNVGTQTFTIGGFTIAPNGTAQFVYNGSAWTLNGNVGGSGNFIQNQYSVQQPTSNFWISGNARVDTGVLTPLLDTATGVALDIGTTNATAINIGHSGINTIIAGTLQLSDTTTDIQFTGAGPSGINSNASLGFQVDADNNGGSPETIDFYDGTNNIFFSANESSQFTFGNQYNPASLNLIRGSYGASINTTTLTGNRTITLPDATGTVLLDSTIGTAAIQNQNASQQTSANYWISGTGRADTSVLTPLLDTASGVALNIGTTNATQINLNKNTQVTGNITLAAGANRTVSVQNQTASNTAGNNLTLQAASGNGTGVGGNLTLRAGAGGATSADGGQLFLYGGNGTAANGSGGAIWFSGGSGVGNGQGGTITFNGGGGGTTGVGGDFNLHGGSGGAGGGNVSITGGGGTAGNANGGNFDIDGGAKSGSGTAGAVTIGSTNASAITIGRSGITTTNQGALTVNQTLTASSTAALNGNTTIGDASTDRLTLTAQILGGSPFVLQGATDNAYATTIAVTDPTANRTITLPDASGTVCLDSGNCATAGSGYILNQSSTPGTAQTGNFNITGTGILGALGVNVTSAANKLNVNALTVADATAQLAVSTGGTTNKGIVIQRVASQTANPFEVQNESGTPIAYVAASGNIISEGELISQYSVRSSDGTGASSNFTVRSGNTTGGSGLSTGSLTLKSGNGTGTNTSSGDVIIDSGSKSGSGTTGQIQIGATNASAINIGRSGITTTNTGALTVSQTLTASSTVALNGNTTIGDANTDRLTVTAQILGASPLVFQGATDNGFTTTFAFTDPTGNNTITFPDASGTVQLAPTSGSYLLQVPGSTAANTVTPTANGVVGLTVNGTSGTAATALAVSQPGAAAGITIASANNTATNGLSFSGTFTNLINATNFNVSQGGTVTATSGFLAPTFDTASAVALNIGTTNATQINLNKTTQVTGDLNFANGADRIIKINNAASGAGNNLTIQGATGTSNNNGGNVTVQAGSSGGGTTGNGGGLTFLGGTANSTNGNGGNVTFNTGLKGTGGTAGSIIFAPQNSSNNSTNFVQIRNGSGTAILNVDSTNNIVQVAGALDTTTAAALNIGTTNATGINLGKTSGSNTPTTVNGTLLVKPTPGNDSATAFQVVNSSSNELFTIDSTNTRVTIGSTGGCSGGVATGGRLCVATTNNTNSGATNQNNTFNISTGAGTSNYASYIRVTDTSTAQTNTNYGLYVDMSTSTTNNSATQNAITAIARTQNAGNLLKLTAGATDVLTVSNSGTTSVTGTTNINTSGSANTTIGAGSTGTVAIGNSGTGAITIQSGTSIGLTGATTINGSTTITNASLSLTGTQTTANNAVLLTNTIKSPTNTQQAVMSLQSNFDLSTASGGNLASLFGIVSTPTITVAASGTVTDAYGIYSRVDNTANTVITNSYGLFLGNATGSNIVNKTGLFISNVSGGSSTNNQLTLAASSGNPLLNISGTGTTTFRTATNSATGFQVQNTSGNEVLTVDTTNGKVLLGKTSNLTGQLQFNSASGSGSITLAPANPGSTAYSITLPAANGTVCLDSGNCSTAGSGYILNQSGTPGSPQSGNFNISGTGIAGTALLSNTFDASTAAALNIGNTTATAINIGSTAVAHAITIGNTTGATGITMNVGTGSFNLSGVTNSTYTIGTNTTTGTILIGGTAQTGAITLGSSSGTNTVNIANGAGAGTVNIANVQNAGSVNIGAGMTTGTINIGGTGAQTGTINLGTGTGVQTINLATGGTGAKTVTLGSSASTSTLTLQAGSGASAFVVNTGGTTSFTLSGSSNNAYFGLGVTSAAPTAFTVSATGSSTTGVAGGSLTLQGGNATVGNANGGNLNLSGGTGFGTGVKGLVVVDTATFATASLQSSASSTNVTLANVNTYGAILLSATASGVTFSLPDPTITTAGRVIYITNAGSNDFTLSVNGGGTGNTVTLKPNTTATMYWNGSDWTAAGASSSTDLQAAYNNTATSAGGAELILNAPGGSADGLTIRNNPTTQITGGILEVQSSIGTNLFSVNDMGGELAANGGAETSSGFGTNWTGAPAGGSASRTTTAGQYVTGQAGVSMTTTSTTLTGVRNNLSANPAINTTYTVSFTAKSSLNGTQVDVAYSPIGGTSPVSCTTYGTGVAYATLSNTVWTKVTCTITTDGTTVTNPDLMIRKIGATTPTVYIDNLSFIRNDNTTQPSNVQIGGGITGGQVTLFTLDRASSPPVADGNTTYFGSMYYDTTSGRIQCYEADGWGACGSPPDNIIVLTPEYTGAVLNGTGVGTMTADFCANSAALSVGTLCASGVSRNFYKWNSPQATMQTYSIYVSYKLPNTFKTFQDANTMTLTWLTDSASGTDGYVSYQVFRSTGSAITSCDGTNESTQATPSANTWYTTAFNGDETACGFSGGDNIIFKINVKAKNNANVYVENLNFTYMNS